MTGRGTFVWASGERYDGGWREGKEDGNGARPPARSFRLALLTRCRHIHLARRVILRRHVGGWREARARHLGARPARARRRPQRAARRHAPRL